MLGSRNTAASLAHRILLCPPLLLAYIIIVGVSCGAMCNYYDFNITMVTKPVGGKKGAISYIRHVLD